MMSRAMSRIDLFVKPGTKSLHHKIVNLIAKSVLSTLSSAVELNFQSMGVQEMRCLLRTLRYPAQVVNWVR